MDEKSEVDRSSEVQPPQEEYDEKMESVNILNTRMLKLKKNLPFLSILLFVLGVASIALFPSNMIANNTYVSENALLPSFSDSDFGEQHQHKAKICTSEFIDHFGKYPNDGNITLSKWLSDWIAIRLQELRLSNVHQHSFVSDGKEGMNTIGILKSARASGTEAVVLTSRTFHQHFHRRISGGVSSLCLSFTLLEYLQSVKWLSKDVIFVATDSAFKDESIKLWLERYHEFYNENDFEHSLESGITTLKQKDLFYRGGEIRGALALDFYSNTVSQLVVVPEGINGKLPNLDLINAIDRVAGYSENLGTTLRDKTDSTMLYQYFYSKNAIIPFADVPVPIAQTMIFILHCAFGVPTGDHSWFHKYNIDAVTLKVIGDGSIDNMAKAGRVVEGTIRCLSNLVEHFHQSFYLYILAGMTYRYVSIGQYLIVTGVVLGPVLAALFRSMFLGDKNRPLCYPRAVSRTLVFEFCGLFCFFIFPILEFNITAIGLVTIGLALVSMYIVEWLDCNLRSMFYKSDDGLRPAEDICLHTSLYPILFFLSVFSLLNWSFCILVAIFTIPIFIVFTPNEQSPLKNRLCSIVMILVSFPMLLVWLSFLIPGSYPETIVQWMYTNFTLYFSLFYPYFTLIYIPLNLSHFVTSATSK